MGYKWLSEWHRIILHVDPTAIPRPTPQALLSGAWSLTSRTSQARTTLPRALEVPMDSVGRRRMVEKSTINRSCYGKIHYKGKFYGKIHYKWRLLWENPLQMEVFMGKYTTNGSFYGKIHYKRKFLWENPLEMEVVMGKSAINRSFYGKIHYKWKFLWKNPL